jgi:hypothetical protein
VGFREQSEAFQEYQPKIVRDHAMRHLRILSAILIAALFAAGTAASQQPPDVAKTIMDALLSQHDVNVVKLDTQAAKIVSPELQLAGIQAVLGDLQPKLGLVAQR